MSRVPIASEDALRTLVAVLGILLALSSDERWSVAFVEAESYDGPSLIIAYSHCIAHGINMRTGFDQHKAAVDSGAWILYRYDPRRTEQGLNPLQLDSKAPKIPFKDYAYNEARFRMLAQSRPKQAERLDYLLEKSALHPGRLYGIVAQKRSVPLTPSGLNWKLANWLPINKGSWGMGLATSIAMGVSGLWGAYFTEVAERKRDLNDLENHTLTDLSETRIGRASRMAGVIVALVDGLAPFFSALIVLLPFFFSVALKDIYLSYYLSLGIALLSLFGLGAFLGMVSRENVTLWGLKMIGAGLLSIGLGYFLGRREGR